MRLKSKYDWNIRKTELMAAELTKPLLWYFMSFANDQLGFLGAVIVEAHGAMEAYEKACKLGASPIGPISFKVAFIAVPIDDVPDDLKNRFLSAKDIRRHLGALLNIDTDGEMREYEQ